PEPVILLLRGTPSSTINALLPSGLSEASPRKVTLTEFTGPEPGEIKLSPATFPDKEFMKLLDRASFTCSEEIDCAAYPSAFSSLRIASAVTTTSLRF